jgi:ionotropic kainate glutamate receptor 3/ionotropic kainate glutamate receptor 5
LVVSDIEEVHTSLQASEKSLKTLKKDADESINIHMETWDSVLADLYLSEKFSLFLVRADDRNNLKYTMENRVTGRKHGSYILVIGGRQTEAVVGGVRQQITRLKAGRDWNPRARFLVLLMSTESGKKVQVEHIFSELWKCRIVNVVILTRAVDIGLREGDDLVELLPVFDVYTWFPYQTPNKCNERFKAVLIDRWVLNKSNNSHFLYNVSLYPQKVPKDFHGCPLRVSGFEFPPVIMGMKQNDEGNTVYEQGTEVRLLEEIAKRSNMSIAYRPPPPENEFWGDELGNGSWTGLTGEVARGYSDIALDNFWYKCHITNDLECLIPHVIDTVRWFVPCAKPYPLWTSITRVFKAYLWLGLLVAYIISSLFMWLVVTIRNAFPSPYTRNEAYTHVVRCFLNFWALILAYCAPNSPPQELSTRCAFLMWVLYCWALNTVYQTFLTSFLVDSGLQTQISSEEEILRSGIMYGVHRTIVAHLPHLASKTYSRRVDCITFKECQDRTAFKGDFAFLFSALNMEYVIAERYTDGNGKPLICILDEVVTSQIISLPVTKGLPMLDEFNGIIQHVIEAGLLEQWLRDIKYTATLMSARDFGPVSREYTKLTLDNLQSPFYFLFFGHALSVITFLIELIFRRKLQ